MSDTLHQQIMNLPADGSTLDWANTREAYLYGHRDARHAAAELVAAAAASRDAEVQRLREDAERYRWLRECGAEQLNAAMHYASGALDTFVDAARAALKEQQ